MNNQFSLQDLTKLKNFTNVALHKINLDLRRIRRNKALIQDQYDNTPKSVILESGIASPDEEIENLKIARQEARLILAKVERLMKCVN